MITAETIYRYIREKENCTFSAKPETMLTNAVEWNSFNGSGLCFYRGDEVERLKKWEGTDGGLIITSFKHEKNLKQGPFLFVENPKRAFVYAAGLFKGKQKGFIHPGSIIDPEALIGKNVSIGARAVIGKCRIGDNSSIGAGAIISDKVEIGNNCVIMNGAIIGEAGLGSVIDYDGNQLLFPHFFGVKMGNYVVVGPGSIVNGGVLTDTEVGDYTHISSACLVAHNSKLGRNIFICAGVTIAGSVKIGDRCLLGLRVSVRDQVELAEGITVGIGTTVVASCLEKDTTLTNNSKVVQLGKLFNFKRA